MSDLENIAIGDKVLLCGGGWNRSMEIRTVEKVYKLHFTLDASNTKYRKSSGNAAGEFSYLQAWVKRYSESEWNAYRAEVRERKMRGFIARVDWNKCDISLIESVYSLLPKEESK